MKVARWISNFLMVDAFSFIFDNKDCAIFNNSFADEKTYFWKVVAKQHSTNSGRSLGTAFRWSLHHLRLFKSLQKWLRQNHLISSEDVNTNLLFLAVFKFSKENYEMARWAHNDSRMRWRILIFAEMDINVHRVNMTTMSLHCLQNTLNPIFTW